MTDRTYVLLVIDMLADFFEQSPVLSGLRAGLVSRTNRLVRAFREHGQPVIWVRQEFRMDLEDAFLAMRRENLRVTIAGTPGCRVLPELDRHPRDIEIVKKRYSAFFKTELDERLAACQPDTLVVSGINTHACVRTTVIDAYQRDYDVIVAADCIASYDPRHHEVTVRYLDGTQARFMENDAILSLLEGPNGREAASNAR